MKQIARMAMFLGTEAVITGDAADLADSTPIPCSASVPGCGNETVQNLGVLWDGPVVVTGSAR